MSEPIPPDHEPPSGPGKEFYAKHFARLTEIAQREYALERKAAEELAYDVLVAFMPRAGHISNPTQWLDASIRGAGKLLRGERPR